MTESPQQPGADHPGPPASDAGRAGAGDAGTGADPWADATDPGTSGTGASPSAGATGSPGAGATGSPGAGATGATGSPGAGATGAGAGDASPRAVWSEVGRRFQDLGRAVRTHLDPESPDAATWSPPPPGEPAGDRSDDWRDDRWADARFAARRIGRSAQQLAAQAGEAARDPAVRESAQQAARSLGDAISRAAEDFGAQLRQNVRSPRWSDPTGPRPEPEPPVAPVRPEDRHPEDRHPTDPTPGTGDQPPGGAR